MIQVCANGRHGTVPVPAIAYTIVYVMIMVWPMGCIRLVWLAYTLSPVYYSMLKHVDSPT